MRRVILYKFSYYERFTILHNVIVTVVMRYFSISEAIVAYAYNSLIHSYALTVYLSAVSIAFTR